MNRTPDRTDRVQRFVVQTVGLALVLVATTITLSATTWQDRSYTLASTPLVVALALAITTVGQVAYVRVSHGGTTEELNFFEVALAAGILVLAPTTVLVASLVGVLIGEILIRREWIKIAYNLASYAVATSAMIITYQALNDTTPQPEEPLAVRTVLSLIAAAAVFTAVNTLLLARLLNVTTGARSQDVLEEEWRLSSLMALGSVGVASVAVGLALTGNWALVPFALLPALALWYAYGASAQHAEARERNKWLVRLGGALARHRTEDTLTESIEAVRRIVEAPESLVLDPADPSLDSSDRHLLASLHGDAPRELGPTELPDGWSTGVVTRLDLGSGGLGPTDTAATAEQGALLLGSRDRYRRGGVTGRTRGWALQEGDRAVLGALVAAVGSAMRAGAAFEALDEETRKLTAVVDNTSDGIAMVDDAGHVKLWSRTMARMTGVGLEELAGGAEQGPPIVRRLVAAARQSWPDRRPAPVQVHLVRGDGEELDVSVATVRVREATATTSGDASGWVSILTVHDETRERRVDRMKSDFVATISHELKTPITPIKGYAQLLSTRPEGFDQERRTKALKVISDRADHLARLVDDLLLASKIDGPKLAVDMGLEDLSELVGSAVAAFPQLAERLQVRLPDEMVLVQCDKVRVHQCLGNLLENAKKYAPGDSPIEIRAERVGLQARVHVRDHGPGIPESEREKVFERFYRCEDPFTAQAPGAGLGLHIARQLAVAMGGGLELLAPRDGSGAEFVLHLQTDAAPPVAAFPAAPRNPAAQDDDDLAAALGLPGGAIPTGPPVFPPVSESSVSGGDGTMGSVAAGTPRGDMSADAWRG